MEDLDSRLFITDVEVSCWQDQLRQAVSIYFSLNSKSSFLKMFFFWDYKYYVLINISFWFTQILITHDQTFIMPNFYFIGICGDYFNSFAGQLCPYQGRQAKGCS